jgi:hypothetical protein
MRTGHQPWIMEEMEEMADKLIIEYHEGRK